MTIRFETPTLREDLIQDLRKLATQGASVRELVNKINVRLGYRELEVIPTLAYFRKAFCLRLEKVLPIREWLGTEEDDEINALILPEIENAKDKWSRPEEQPARATD